MTADVSSSNLDPKITVLTLPYFRIIITKLSAENETLFRRIESVIKIVLSAVMIFHFKI